MHNQNMLSNYLNITLVLLHQYKHVAIHGRLLHLVYLPIIHLPLTITYV